MTSENLACVVLAAGKGTRMKSQRPKVLHEVAGRPMLAQVLETLSGLAPERIVVVVGPGMDAVAAAAAPHPSVVQAEQLGTGHAVLAARPALQGYEAEGGGDVLVVFGDTPLITRATLERMRAARTAEPRPALVALAFRARDPGAYGRMAVDAGGHVTGVVEALDADVAMRQVDLCNAGVLLADGRHLFQLLQQVGCNNAKNEYYLPDVFALGHQAGLRGVVVEAPEEEVQGVNSQAELAQVEVVMQTRLRAAAMAAGVTLVDPAAVWLSHDTELAPEVVIEPNVVFGRGVRVEEGARIRAFSHLEGASVAAGAVVGPFARLRPGTRVGEGARVGNFVEVKNAHLGAGAKANHLTYLGDSDIGAGSNIGAGTITCNYDGFNKHRTEIGEAVFVGSNTALVAPVKLGDGVIVGAGSTITKDVPAEALAVARGDQKTYEGAARRFRKSRQSAAKPKRRKAAKEG